MTTNLLCTADLKQYFRQVHISSSNVTLRFHNQGMRYRITIDDDEPRIGKYGETICLSTNQSMRVVSRGTTLELKGFSDEEDVGFLVASKMDLRSLGGGLMVKKARWIINSKKRKIENDEGLFEADTTALNVQDEAKAIIKTCNLFAVSKSSLLHKNPDAVVVTNRWDTQIDVINGVTNCIYSYALKDGCTSPRSVRLRNRDNSGFDIHFNKDRQLTKYVEYRQGHLYGLYLEFYTNNLVRTCMNLSNDWIIGEQLYFDERGHVSMRGHICMPIGELKIKCPPPDM